MTDLETRLDQALQADAPPARDPMFRIAVMERRERAALRRRLAAASALAFGAAIVAALVVGELGILPVAARLGAAAAGGAALAALVAAPYVGGTAALRGLVARASWTLRTMPRPRLWS